MKIFIGSDHRGYELKEKLKDFLEEENIDFEDLGNLKYNPKDDYPDIALKVAKNVIEEEGKGILLCGSGQGVCVAANKIKGIRAGVLYNEELAKQAVEDDDINILCLATNHISEELAKSIVKTFINTEFSRKKRHIRRLNKVKEIENGKY